MIIKYLHILIVYSIYTYCILIYQVVEALADPVFKNLYDSYKMWPQYATVLDDLITHHKSKSASINSNKRKKRRLSMQSTLFNETQSEDGSSTTYTYNKRPKAEMRKKKMESDTGNLVMRAAKAQDKICGHCLSHDPGRINLATITESHRAYHDQTFNERKLWMFNVIGQDDSSEGFLVESTDEHNSIHRFRLCNECFSLFHGFGRSTLQRSLRQYRAGVRRQVELGSEVDHSHKRLVCSEWIIDKSTSYGDYMPDALAVVMPVYTKKELWNWYKQECEVDSLSYPRFAAILKKDFPFIRFRRHKKFTQCRLCNLIDMKISKSRVSILIYVAVIHVFAVIYIVLYVPPFI